MIQALDAETFWFRLGPSELHQAKFQLDRGPEHRIVCSVQADHEVALVLWRGIDAMRVERGAKGRLEGEHATARGSSFEMHTGAIAGGFWLLTIENMTGIETDVVIRIRSEHGAVEAPCSCSITVTA